MSAPDAGNGLPAPINVPRADASAPGVQRTPRAGLPPASPSLTPRGAGRRSMDASGTPRRGRHTVEVPEGAAVHEGLVVSRQEKFGFIKGTTHEGRYFFHVNDSDGDAPYGATVSFVVAHDLTTGKDVAYRVRTLAHAPPPGSASPRAPRAATPDRAATPPPGEGLPGAPPEAGEAAAAPPPRAATPPQPAPGGLPPAQPGAGPRRQPPAPAAGGDAFGRPGFEHFGQGHRQPSPATQRDWRTPQREAAAAAAAVEAAMRRAAAAAPAAHEAAHEAAAQFVAPGVAPGVVPGVVAGVPLAPPPPAERFRGTVAQVARAARHHCMDDGLLLYVDADGQQCHARYGTYRLAEGSPRLEPGDLVEFGVGGCPGAGTGHRRVADDVRFLAKGLPSPSLEAALGAAEGGDGARGRQLGRVQLLKKEFGFIRQADRPGDMFFHFSQLEGWGPEGAKVGDDVEYNVRRDREGKLSAVQIRRAPPGAVVFEVVGEELLRGVVLERPISNKQYMGTSGVLEYDAAPPEAPPGGGPPPPPPPPGLAPGRLRLPFMPSDVAPGSGSLRPGDHVFFRIATNLQAARAAAAASVPGAAQYAGKRAVGVGMVRYAGTVVQVNRERQFGFVQYGEDQLLPVVPAPVATTAAPAEGAAGEPGADAPPAEGAAAEPAAADAPASAPAAAAAEAGGADEGTADGGEAGTGGEGAGEAPPPPPADAPPATPPPAEGPPATPPQPRRRLFFHFKEVAGQYILKPGDEVAFVLHSNLKSGELNAQRVRRTKEGPELPPPPEPEPRPTPVPAVNPNKNKYSGNLSSGKYKQPQIARGPDGTRGFELPRPGAAMPPLPGLEPKPEPEPEPEAGEGEEGGGAEAAAATAAAAAAAAAAALRGPVAGGEDGARAPAQALSVAAPTFVPRAASSGSLDAAAATPPAPASADAS